MRHKKKAYDFLKKEDHLHIQVCRYIKLQYPKAILHHSPNEGKRSFFERYLLKVLNTSAGFPDLLIFLDKKVIALELKVGKNQPTLKQKLWFQILNTAGIPTVACWSFDEARGFIDKHFSQ